ncbi:hypothetical protein GCM10017778_19200 [Streptomyces vinaceus]|nr:hypothetical protein GCM10017778_19200 [Streptomyces vinaceus]
MGALRPDGHLRGGGLGREDDAVGPAPPGRTARPTLALALALALARAVVRELRRRGALPG